MPVTIRVINGRRKLFFGSNANIREFYSYYLRVRNTPSNHNFYVHWYNEYNKLNDKALYDTIYNLDEQVDYTTNKKTITILNAQVCIAIAIVIERKYPHLISDMITQPQPQPKPQPKPENNIYQNDNDYIIPNPLNDVDEIDDDDIAERNYYNKMKYGGRLIMSRKRY
jgi:hypothetical protein